MMFRLILEAIVARVIPVPIISSAIAGIINKYKFHFLLIVLAIILSLAAIFNGGFQSNAYGQPLEFGLPEELKGYIEEGYFETFIPRRSPVGGTGMNFTKINSYYYDVGYYKTFGFWHDGLDIVPTSDYYTNSKAYKLTGKLILIATMSGKACSYGSENKGYTVEITSPDGQHKALFHHQSVNFIPLDTCTNITTGQPLGIMGKTGFATGIHVHYMTFKWNGQKWVDYDPYPTLV